MTLDCRFIASDAGTVHECREWPGDAHDYDAHPKCGQRLPVGSEWSRVPAESIEDLAERWDLEPVQSASTRGAGGRRVSHERPPIHLHALRKHRSRALARSRFVFGRL